MNRDDLGYLIIVGVSEKGISEILEKVNSEVNI